MEVLALLQEGGNGGIEDLLPNKGLFSLPFMSRALKLQHDQVAGDAEELVRELEGLPSGGISVSFGEGGFAASNSAVNAPDAVHTGRLKFGSGADTPGPPVLIFSN